MKTTRLAGVLLLSILGCTKTDTEQAATPPKAPSARPPPKPAPPPIPAPADVAAAPADAEKLPDGLAFKVLTPGTGKEHPQSFDKVSVHYTGWTTDGKMFDSSVSRGQPATFPLTNVIPGWTEVVQKMVQGEKIRTWIPQDLAYKGMPGKPAGMLVFEIELLNITKGKPPPPVPADVAAPPKDAIKTASGLAYKILKKGTGTVHPQATNTVQVDYTGWQTTGKMFDSSVVRGQPATFPLNRVIPGWTEGVQLLTEGEEALFWIPQDLAYKGQKGPPEGTLVFDITLLKIMPAVPPRGIPPQVPHMATPPPAPKQ